MSKLIVGNWKMQKLFSDIHPYFKPFKHKVYSSHIKLGLAVPSVFIKPCLEEMNTTPFILGAQDVSMHKLGAYTGEISAEQLASMPVSFSLVGHSERRKHFKETSHEVLCKAKKLQEASLMPIVCIGETLDEKPHFERVLKQQLEEIFELSPKNLAIAYEPVWAIGTGVSAEMADIQRVHGFIKNFLKERSRDFSLVPVLYGGSVNEKNASAFLELDEVGGLLIGGASLDPVAFEKLVSQLGKRV